MTSTSVFFGIGHFVQWVLEAWEAAKWTAPVVIIAVLLFGMGYWLAKERTYTRKAKERGDFI